MDIFEYWRDVPPTAQVHPDDQAILAATAHGFDLRCLPGQMAGLLPSAPVVLLFLSGGRSDEFDIRMAESQERVAEYGRRRLGLLPLWGPDEHRDAWNWWTRVTRSLGFYGRLLGLDGRKQAGSRCYITCGPVTLQVIDVSSVGKPHPAPKALYFTVKDLDAVFARAKSARVPRSRRCSRSLQQQHQRTAVERAIVLC